MVFNHVVLGLILGLVYAQLVQASKQREAIDKELVALQSQRQTIGAFVLCFLGTSGDAKGLIERHLEKVAVRAQESSDAIGQLEHKGLRYLSADNPSLSSAGLLKLYNEKHLQMENQQATDQHDFYRTFRVAEGFLKLFPVFELQMDKDGEPSFKLYLPTPKKSA